jgi:O-acetyl-ADP-ribose deacetylase (regulator of RNase III)
MKPTFKLILVDFNGELKKEWDKVFVKRIQEGEVETHQGRFEDLDFDCVVSPANSFGQMDGGFDEALTMYFGDEMVNRVQDKIIKDYGGEQPVGTSFLVRGTEYGKEIKYVAHTPTMIIPMNISQTTNVYMSMKAMLLAVEKHNQNPMFGEQDKKIETVLCPGLGTGAGRVPYGKAAMDMYRAYTNVYDRRPEELNWDFAIKRYNEHINNQLWPHQE